jgi:hypothetical protein
MESNGNWLIGWLILIGLMFNSCVMSSAIDRLGRNLGDIKLECKKTTPE